MQRLIVSLAALGLLGTPALAAPSKSTKTITTTNKAGTVKATTTVSTKVTPVSTKGQAKARVAKRRHVSHSQTAAVKKTTSAKKG